MQFTAQLAEGVHFPGADGDEVEAYLARPSGPGPYPGLVVIHHAPGLDEETLETTRRLADHGYATLTPHLYTREAREVDPKEAAKYVRAEGGLNDAQMLGDMRGAVAYLRAQPYSSGRVGVLGFCSGGRQAYIVACQVPLDAAVDCYGGSVVAGPDKLTPSRPVAPIDMTPTLSCPLLGIFGGRDPHVPPDHIDAVAEATAAHGKQFEYHVYPEAGHAFLGHLHGAYRVADANAAWERIFDFLGRTLHG